jgi:hypothetical protein
LDLAAPDASIERRRGIRAGYAELTRMSPSRRLG